MISLERPAGSRSSEPECSSRLIAFKKLNRRSTVKIIRAGAVEIVSKPFTDQKLKMCIKNVLSSETKENTDI